MLDPHRTKPDQFAHRTVDRVRVLLAQPTRQRRPSGHPGARGVAVAKQYGIKAHCTVTDVRVEQPLRNDREPLLDDQLSLSSVSHEAPALMRAPLR
jgi:hypothetical protein